MCTVYVFPFPEAYSTPKLFSVLFDTLASSPAALAPGTILSQESAVANHWRSASGVVFGTWNSTSISVAADVQQQQRPIEGRGIPPAAFQFWAVRQTKVSCSEKTRAEQLYHKSAASALSRRTIKAKHIKVGSQSEPVVAGSVQGSSLTLLGPAACTQVRPAPVGHRKHREAPADARVCVCVLQAPLPLF